MKDYDVYERININAIFYELNEKRMNRIMVMKRIHHRCKWPYG